MEYKKHPVLQEFDRLNNMIDELYYEVAARQGLSESAYSILQAMLVLGNGCTQTDVYKYTLLNKQTVNSSVRKLCSEGILTFHHGTGREQKLFLTEKGNQIVCEKIIPIEQAENEIFDEMTPEDQQAILRIMSGYLESFREKIEKL